MSKTPNRMYNILDFLVLTCCFFLTTKSQTGQILPPQNVSLRWVKDFCAELSWVPPPHPLTDCTYEVLVHNPFIKTYGINTTTWKAYNIMEGPFLNLSVITICNTAESTEASINAFYQELVKDVQCYIYSASEAYCSWTLVTHTPDFRFYYELVNESQNESPTNHQSNEDECYSTTQECSRYNFTNGMKTGCYLKATVFHGVSMLFNGTVNNTYARNTFKRLLKNDIRPPALKWSIQKNKNMLNISWTPPDVPARWTYKINYTFCNEHKSLSVSEVTFNELLWDPSCSYRISVQATSQPYGETPWSDEKYLDIHPDVLLYAAVLIPLMVACLVAVAFGFFWRFKKRIFPKVPQPHLPFDLIDEISDNNNKINLGKTYVPPEEEEGCKITLVEDPQI